nr:MAG TPA: hypothetical protein [Caudoviricetes sp.]
MLQNLIILCEIEILLKKISVTSSGNRINLIKERLCFFNGLLCAIRKPINKNANTCFFRIKLYNLKNP